MKFWFIANAVFEANDIEDALQHLALHFEAESRGEDHQLFLPPSEIDIRPMGSPDAEEREAIP